MPRMLSFLFLSAMVLPRVFGQQVVAPTPEPVGRIRGEDIQGYNITNSFETGYRFREVHGNLGKYRSDVNFGNGIRLLGSSLTVNSKDGHGRFFDEILLTTQGLGNDPYQISVLRIQKNRMYDYNMTWRLNEYFNPALTISDGQHLINTRYRLQDHDLTLLPQTRFKFRLGFSRGAQTGPALSTFQVFDARGDEFPIFADVHRIHNEYRIGGNWQLLGFRFNWLRSWDNFKEDTPSLLPFPSPGNNPNDLVTLSSFRRTDPTHGNAPLWRVNVNREQKDWAFNGRFSYAGGRRNFALDESAIGTDQLGANRNRQVFVTGNARRPVTTGDFTLSIFPAEKLSLVNNTSIFSTRIDGKSAYVDFNNGTRTNDILFFQFLGVRAVTNSTDLNYRVTKALGFYAGYQYSTRLIRSVESFTLPGATPDRTAAEQNNHLHSGRFGIRLWPLKPLSVNLDAEVSRADRPFTPLSDRNFHALGGRAQYKVRNLLLSAGYRENYNTNSVSLSTHSSRGRNYTADISWTCRRWFNLDAGYSKIHLDSVSGIAFFAGGQLLQGLNSIYVSNIHAGNLGARVGVRPWLDLFAGYSITRDTGDGRRALNPSDPLSTLLVPAQSFPLRFESPLARISVRLNQKLRWNAGWQFYRYREDFPVTFIPQNYRANTGYSSLLWTF